MDTIDVLAFVVGLFFFLARFRFFYDPSAPAGSRFFNAGRYASLSSKLASCGWRRGLAFWTWFAAVAEVAGGLSFMLDIGRPIAGPVLIGVLLAATACTAVPKCLEQNPVDKLDVCCAYLWRVEGLYIVMTGLVVWSDWAPILDGLA